MNHWFGNGDVKSLPLKSDFDKEQHDVGAWFLAVLIGCLFVSSL